MKFTDAVGEAWEELKDDKSDVTYVLVGYDDKKTIGLKSKGPGGRKACLALCASDSDIVFGGFRVTAIDDRSNTTSRRTKFVFFHYQAPNAPMMAKAKAGSHRTECEHVMSGSHVQFQVDGLHELSEAEIVAKLRRCGGAHQPTGFDFGEGDDGVSGGTVVSFHDSRRFRLIKRMFAAAQAQSSRKIKQRRMMTSRTGISSAAFFFNGGARVGAAVGDAISTPKLSVLMVANTLAIVGSALAAAAARRAASRRLGSSMAARRSPSTAALSAGVTLISKSIATPAARRRRADAATRVSATRSSVSAADRRLSPSRKTALAEAPFASSYEMPENVAEPEITA